MHLLKAAHEAGITLPGATATYDSGIAKAKEDCCSRLSQAQAPFFDILCDQAADAALDRFDNIFAGCRSQSAGRRVAFDGIGDGLIASPEDADL